MENLTRVWSMNQFPENIQLLTTGIIEVENEIKILEEFGIEDLAISDSELDRLNRLFHFQDRKVETIG